MPMFKLSVHVVTPLSQALRAFANLTGKRLDDAARRYARGAMVRPFKKIIYLCYLNTTWKGH